MKEPPPFYYNHINCLCKCFINKRLDHYLISFASLPLTPWYSAPAYSMTKCVIYTCLRETFPHLNAVPRQREERGWARGVESIVDILIYNFLFLRALKDEWLLPTYQFVSFLSIFSKCWFLCKCPWSNHLRLVLLETDALIV